MIIYVVTDEHHMILVVFHPKMSPRSHSLVCIKNRLFIVRIGPILNKEL